MSKFGSLLGDVAFTLNSNASAVAIQMIPLDRIKSDPNNPRKAFDQTQLEEMAESIKARGILQPITVRPLEGGTTFMVRYGDRRFRAAALAGLTEIRAIVTDSKVSEDDLFDQVIENDQRADLTTNELAAAVWTWREQGKTPTEIAKRLGRPKSRISEYVALAEMPEFLKALADTTAIRTLYELYQGWKSDPEKIEAFVAASGETPIRRSAAQALVKGANATPAEKPGAAAPAPNPDEPPLPLGGDGSSTGRNDTESSTGRNDQELVAKPPETPEKDTENSSRVNSDAAPAAPTGVKRGPAEAPQTPDAKGASVSSKARVPLSDTGSDIAVIIDGRRARLVLPATVDVIFEDDGSSASVDRASVNAAEE